MLFDFGLYFKVLQNKDLRLEWMDFHSSLFLFGYDKVIIPYKVWFNLGNFVQNVIFVFINYVQIFVCCIHNSLIYLSEKHRSKGTVVPNWESTKPLFCSKFPFFKTSWWILRVLPLLSPLESSFIWELSNEVLYDTVTKGASEIWQVKVKT